MRLPAWLQTLTDWVDDTLIKWRFFYTAVFFGCAFPGAELGWRIYQALYQGQDTLGVNPVETMLHETGETALAMLLLSMTVTPLRRLFGWNRLQIVRRMVGIWSFVYALAHFGIYVVFDQLGEIGAIWDDIANRPFITMGMVALAILCVLAATSFKVAMRLLGRNWGRLHKLVYIAGIAGVIHFIWGQKADIAEPLKWAVWLGVILGVRVYFWNKKRRQARVVPGSGLRVPG